MQHILETDTEFLEKLGQFIVDCSLQAVSDHGYFSIAFSGGSAATKICAAFEHEKFNKATDWSKWKIFFCDERYVELDHPDSNYKAINDGLVKKHSNIRQENIFTLNKTGNISKDAEDYESKMRGVFSDQVFPKIDVIVLGMGPDGHICSLFPNHLLLKEERKWIGFLEDSPKPPSQRITFTLNVVNNGCNVLFITTGEGKAENVKKAIKEQPSENIPASLVNPKNGVLHWFMDKGASGLLKSS